MLGKLADLVIESDTKYLVRYDLEAKWGIESGPCSSGG